MMSAFQNSLKDNIQKKVEEKLCSIKMQQQMIEQSRNKHRGSILMSNLSKAITKPKHEEPSLQLKDIEKLFEGITHKIQEMNER